MAQLHRTLLLWPLAGLAGIPLAAGATELNVIGSDGNIVSTVELQTVRYSAGSKKLVATTAAGNTACAQGQAPSEGQVGLEIDGVSYGVLADPPGSQTDAIVYDTTARDFTLAVNGAGSGCKSSGITELRLAFNGGAALSVAEAVYFETGTRTLRVRVNEPVLCNTYAAVGTGLTVELVEAHGEPESIPGFERIDYLLGGRLLNAVSGTQPTGGRNAQCFSFTVPVASQPVGGGNSIFTASFEYNDLEADIVASATPSQTTLLAGGVQPFQYELTLENVGNGAASGVRAREYLPGAPGTVTAQAWTCARYAGTGLTDLGCAVPSGSGALNQGGIDIAPGERVVFTLNRTVNGGSAGASLLLGAAAFVHPNPAQPNARPERDYSDNSASVSIGLVDNQPPQVTPPISQGTSEDGQAITLVYSATDPEGNEIQTPIISSNNPGLFVEPLTAVSTGANQWSVTLTPAPDRNGNATITAAFTDNNSSPVQVQTAVSVTAVNDAPEFTLNVPSATIVVTAGDTTCGATGSCTGRANTFVTSMVPGPATAIDEAAQTVRPNTVQDANTDDRLVPGACRAAAQGGVEPADFFFDGVLPRVITHAPGQHDILVSLTRTPGAVECDITVIDNGSPAAESAPQVLTIRYEAAP